MTKAIAYNTHNNEVIAILFAQDSKSLDALIDAQGYDYDEVAIAMSITDEGLTYPEQIETIRQMVRYNVDVVGGEDYRGISFYADSIATFGRGRVVSTTSNYNGQGTDKAIVEVDFDFAEEVAEMLRADDQVISF